ncbi:hypothetical protein PENTCL1PPCAC_15788, partial [Pristionchus entomophagus]
QPNSVTTRPAGFDNALDDNEDGCPFAYKTPDGLPSFPGFSIVADPPMLKLHTEIRLPLHYKSCDEKSETLDITVDGFFSSLGWNGCTKPNSGGLQSFRFMFCIITHKVLTLSNPDDKVTLDVLPNFDS